MTQAFIEGFRIPVTKVTLGPCTVIQIKDINKDGYWAVQLGFGTKKIKNTTKPPSANLTVFLYLLSPRNRLRLQRNR